MQVTKKTKNSEKKVLIRIVKNCSNKLTLNRIVKKAGAVKN